METLVKTWRKLWGEGDFPFYAVQLPALQNISNNPRVREGQAAILSLPNTGMAVTIDIGDPKDVHPHNKEPLGGRLMRMALANVYHRNIEYSGPVYGSMAVEGMTIRVKFSHLGGGLVAKGGPLKWFQISGADRQFVDAEAKIDGDSVVVSRPDVTMPEAVRYAWVNYPDGCNLYNAAGEKVSAGGTSGVHGPDCSGARRGDERPCILVSIGYRRGSPCYSGSVESGWQVLHIWRALPRRHYGRSQPRLRTRIR
jgi:sialate O-acetylesterase